MLIRLLLLFTVVPLLELALLIELGKAVGLFNTIAIVITTGVAGAYLARSQGFGLLSRIQKELALGHMPAESLIDGAMILAGAILLLTPGLITDTLGLALLLPFTRAIIKIYLKNYFQKKIHQGEIQVHYRVDDDSD
ncbi:MAG: FxsA family protein [bacterium]